MPILDATSPAVQRAAEMLGKTPAALAYWLSFYGREYAAMPSADPVLRIVALYRSCPGV